MVSKKSHHFPAAHANTQRRVQFVRIVGHAGAVAAEADTERPPQDAFIRGKPLEAQLRPKGKGLVRSHTLGWPKPLRRSPENTLVVASRARKLFASIFRMAESGRWQ